MSPEQDQAAQGALRQAIARLQPRAQKVGDAFATTTDELKRTQLRSLVDDYRETLSDLQEALDDWSYEGPEAAAPSFPSAPAVAAPTAITPASAPSSGLIGLLKSLPLLGAILRMLGL